LEPRRAACLVERTALDHTAQWAEQVHYQTPDAGTGGETGVSCSSGCCADTVCCLATCQESRIE
jgi:hypothetical protein